MRGETRMVGRLWWTMLRRGWRENTVLPLIAVVFAAVHGGYALAGPQTPQRATLLAASALVTALLAPLALPPHGVLDALRFRLLPLSPARLFLLRPLFGNPLRLVLVALAVAWTLATLPYGGGGARVALEALQVAGWALLGIAAAEVAEELLRATGSAALQAVAMIPLAVSSTVLTGFRRFAPALLAGAPDDRWPPLLGSRGPLAAEAAVAAGLLACAAATAVAGRLLAARTAARPPRGPSGRALPRLVSAAARVAGPRRRAAFAKELAMVTRTPALWPAHALTFACAAAAASSGNAPLAAGGALIWSGFLGNLFGPDVPLRGLARYRLLPRPRWHALPMRHAAIFAASAAGAALAAALVWTLGGRPASPALAAGLAAWVAYGGSLLLLLAVVGDRASLRGARAMGLRGADGAGGTGAPRGAGTAGAGLMAGLAFLAALVAAAAVLLAWAVAVGLAAPALAPLPRATAAAAGASLTQLALYRLHLRSLARA